VQANPQNYPLVYVNRADRWFVKFDLKLRSNPQRYHLLYHEASGIQMVGVDNMRP